MKKLKNYILESIRELHQVTWPTQNQTVRITAITVVFIIVASAFVGVLDWVLSIGATHLISLS